MSRKKRREVERLRRRVWDLERRALIREKNDLMREMLRPVTLDPDELVKKLGVV